MLDTKCSIGIRHFSAVVPVFSIVSFVSNNLFPCESILKSGSIVYNRIIDLFVKESFSRGQMTAQSWILNHCCQDTPWSGQPRLNQPQREISVSDWSLKHGDSEPRYGELVGASPTGQLGGRYGHVRSERSTYSRSGDIELELMNKGNPTSRLMRYSKIKLAAAPGSQLRVVPTREIRSPTATHGHGYGHGSPDALDSLRPKPCNRGEWEGHNRG